MLPYIQSSSYILIESIHINKIRHLLELHILVIRLLHLKKIFKFFVFRVLYTKNANYVNSYFSLNIEYSKIRQHYVVKEIISDANAETRFLLVGQTIKK